MGCGERSRLALARYRPDGALDRSFGRGGKVLTALGPAPGATELAIQPDGKLVAAGSTTFAREERSRFALARYRPDGALDRRFGRGGRVVTQIRRGLGAICLAFALARNGDLIAGGSIGPKDYSEAFALARYRGR